jgi:hypothetical protein
MWQTADSASEKSRSSKSGGIQNLKEKPKCHLFLVFSSSKSFLANIVLLKQGVFTGRLLKQHHLKYISFP